MKVYRAIFRLDYRLSYSLLDRLGEQLEFIQDETAVEPYAQVNGGVDIVRHVIHNEGAMGKDRYSLNLALDNFNADIEFENGLEIQKLAKYRFFELADQVIDKSELRKLKVFNRIGFRVWLLAEDEKLVFESIRGVIERCNPVFTGVLSPHFTSVDDIALVIESKNESGDSIRVNVGPYQEAEKAKYFSLSPTTKEGLIMDVDLWQNKISIPGFKLVDFVKHCQLVFYDVGMGTMKKLLGAVK